MTHSKLASVIMSGLVRSSIHDSRRAQLKCRLLTGTYILQGNRAAFNQYQVDPTCRLCSVSPETRQHFISECSFLNPERSAFIEKLQENPALQHIPSSQFQNPELVTQLTLDASVVLDKEKVDKDSRGLLELQTREFIHKIQHKRLSEIKKKKDWQYSERHEKTVKCTVNKNNPPV